MNPDQESALWRGFSFAMPMRISHGWRHYTTVCGRSVLGPDHSVGHPYGFGEGLISQRPRDSVDFGASPEGKKSSGWLTT